MSEVKKYNLIVIDPPWSIKKITRKARPNQVSMDYKMMDIEEIKALPISHLSLDDCWLFLWTIQKYLYECPNIIKAWGFNLLGTGVWEKTYGRSSGMPLYGFRWNVEFILIGYKKKPTLWPKQPLIPMAFPAENRRHSQKPDIFYDRISRLGDKRIDIFARKKRDGWDVIGDEIDGNDIRKI